MVWAHIFQAKSPVSGLLWLYFAILAYFDPSANEIPLRLPAERYLQPAPEPVSVLGPELAQALELLLALELLHSGRAPKEIAKDLGLSTSTVRRWGEREGGG